MGYPRVIAWQYLPWESRESLEYHFTKHGGGVGAKDVQGYVQSARATVRVGTSFTFRHGYNRRMGYFHPARKRLTVLTDDGSEIVNHFHATEKYVRDLPESTYR